MEKFAVRSNSWLFVFEFVYSEYSLVHIHRESLSPHSYIPNDVKATRTFILQQFICVHQTV